MEKILLADNFSKETLAIISMHYKTRKHMIHLPDGDTDFFDVVTGKDTLASCMFVIYFNYVLRTSINLIKDKDFTFKKFKSKLRPAGAMKDTNQADVVFTPAQAEYVLHSLEQATRVIGLYVNGNNTDLTYFKQDLAIFSLNHKPLKIVVYIHR